jgi:hypothetical protein
MAKTSGSGRSEMPDGSANAAGGPVFDSCQKQLCGKQPHDSGEAGKPVKEMRQRANPAMASRQAFYGPLVKLY